MAGIGLSKPYAAIYTDNGDGTVSYSNCGLLGKATNTEMTLDGGTANVLYADNGAAESDNRFTSGNLTIGTDELLADVVARYFGVSTESITGVETEGAEWLAYGEDQAIPYIGYGAVRKLQINNEIKWKAYVWPKIQLQNRDLAFTTQGETIEWQTPSISATLMRDDTTKHRWVYESSILESEQDAEKAIQSILGVPVSPTP